MFTAMRPSDGREKYFKQRASPHFGASYEWTEDCSDAHRFRSKGECFAAVLCAGLTIDGFQFDQILFVVALIVESAEEYERFVCPLYDGETAREDPLIYWVIDGGHKEIYQCQSLESFEHAESLVREAIANPATHSNEAETS